MQRNVRDFGLQKLLTIFFFVGEGGGGLAKKKYFCLKNGITSEMKDPSVFNNQAQTAN